MRSRFSAIEACLALHFGLVVQWEAPDGRPSLLCVGVGVGAHARVYVYVRVCM